MARHAVQFGTNVTEICVSSFSLADVRAKGKRSRSKRAGVVFNRMRGSRGETQKCETRVGGHDPSGSGDSELSETSSRYQYD